MGVKIQQMLHIRAFPPAELGVGYLSAHHSSQIDLAQMQVLFIYLGGMSQRLALQVIRPIFLAAM